MNYLKIAISVLLVVLIGYLYSCDTDKVTNPSSSDSKEIDAGVTYHECPDMAGHLGTHFCIYLWYNGVEITGVFTTGYRVDVIGRDTITNNIVYTCSYTEIGSGNPNGSALGSRLPYGLNITRSICIAGTPYGDLTGTQQFNSTSHGYLGIDLQDNGIECFQPTNQ